ncbi:MAG: dihydrolipoamide acetyltransferase family protein [bacterium]|nr:dihydrolipoamide acetyltransferase family protein [bacterium]
MAHIMTMPLLAETMDEGTIARWMVKEGDTVKKGDPVVEVETDKANMEVVAVASGVILKIVTPDGATVPVYEPIAVIGEAGEKLPELETGNKAQETAELEKALEAQAPVISPEAVETVATDEGRIKISPRARRMAGDNGVSVEALAGRGSGPGGRIVEKDVEAYLAEKPSVTPLAAKMAAAGGVELSGVAGSGPGGKIYSRDIPAAAVSAPAAGEVIKLAGMRKIIADRLTQSAHTAVQVTLTSEVDMTAAVALRGRLLPAVEKSAGVRLTFTDIIVKATALALSEMPLINSTFDGEEITLHKDVNLGVAVALEQGLVVPVIRNTDDLGLAAISAAIEGLVEKAKQGKLGAAEMNGGTFTVTNLGAFGVEAFTPIINPPQTGILGVGAIKEKPAVVDGQIVPRSMMYLSMVFDHRVMDGADAARFLQRIKALLEQPELMLV